MRSLLRPRTRRRRRPLRVDERAEQLHDPHRVLAGGGQAAKQQCGGHLRAALGDPQLRDPPQRRRMRLTTGEQLFGLRQAALAHA